MTSLVGLDVGTSSVKALALSPEGVVVGRADEDYPLSIPQAGWAEQDPDDWVRAAQAALARVDADQGRVGLSGQMHGLVGLPLQRTTVDEGAAYGAALLAGVADGAFTDIEEAVNACVRVREEIEPDPEWQRVYDEGYGRFRALYPALRPLEAQ